MRSKQRRAAVVTGSVLASIVVFVIVVEVLKRSADFAIRSGHEFGPIRIAFYAVAVSMVFATNLVHGFMLKKETSDDIGRIAARLVTASMVVAALSETPVILGFVLFVVWGHTTDFYILGFVSLYLVLRHFPFYGQWEKFAKRRMGAKWPSDPIST